VPEIIKVLHDEIQRLSVERLDLVGRRSELLEWLDVRIAEIDERVRAAEGMLAAYGQTATDRGFLSAEGADEMRANIETVPLPACLRGHRLNPSSKKARIIKATKVLLKTKGATRRSEILAFLHALGIMSHEKNPDAYLSVVLSYAREIFATNGTEWRLREADNGDQTPE